MTCEVKKAEQRGRRDPEGPVQRAGQVDSSLVFATPARPVQHANSIRQNTQKLASTASRPTPGGPDTT